MEARVYYHLGAFWLFHDDDASLQDVLWTWKMLSPQKIEPPMCKRRQAYISYQSSLYLFTLR
jgi:hypothetical protein